MIVLTVILTVIGVIVQMFVIAYSVAWGLGIYNARKRRQRARDKANREQMERIRARQEKSSAEPSDGRFYGGPVRHVR